MKNFISLFYNKLSIPTRLLPLIAAGLISAGCGGSVADVAAERARNAAQDRALYDSNKPRELYGLTLAQAQALALKYNLGLWMARQQEAIARETKHSSFLKILPSLTFDYNLEGRDSYNASSSLGLGTGQTAQLTTYSYSADKSHSYGGMKMLWNVLDFGITYFRAKQDMNREKQAAYDKERVRQKLCADVADAYWQCVNFDRVAARATALRDQFTAELENLRSGAEKGLLSETESLERSYLLKSQNARIAEFLERQQAVRVHFLQLAGLPLDAKFTLADDSEQTLGDNAYDVDALESTALLQRPELFREDLSEKISRDEVRAGLVSILPSPSLFINPQGDDNSHLYYNSWFNAGLNLSFDLLSVPGKIADAKTNKRLVEFSKIRRMALAVAVLTQVRLAVIEHDFALRRYRMLSDLNTDSEKIAANFAASAKAGKAKGNAALSQKARGLEDYAKLQDAYARVMIARARIAESVGESSARRDYVSAPRENPAPVTQAEADAINASVAEYMGRN